MQDWRRARLSTLGRCASTCIQSHPHRQSHIHTLIHTHACTCGCNFTRAPAFLQSLTLTGWQAVSVRIYNLNLICRCDWAGAAAFISSTASVLFIDSSSSLGGVLAHSGGFGTCGWTDVGYWSDSEPELLTEAHPLSTTWGPT